MRRYSGRGSRIIIWVVSVTIALSMVCSFVPALLQGCQRVAPTPTAVVSPSPTPTSTPQP